MPSARLALLLTATILVPSAAHAKDRQRWRPRVEAAIGTSFPLSVGIAGHIELPYRLLASLEVGWMPGDYVSLANGVIVATGGYDQSTGRIVEAALKDSMILRASGGWRPFRQAGFEMFAGYTLALLGGGSSTAEMVESVTGATLREYAEVDVPCGASAHAFHVGVGWRFDVGDRFVLRVSLAYLQVLAANVDVRATAQQPRTQALVDEAAVIAETYLEHTMVKWVKVPVLGLFGAWRF